MSSHRILHDLLRAPHMLKDPGNAATITVDRQLSSVPLVLGAGAETRTLARPTKPGLITTLSVMTAGGGTCTVTVTGYYNQDNDATFTLSTAADWITFISIQTAAAGTSVWRVVGQEGTSATTEDLLIDTLTVTDLTLNSTTIDAYDSMAAGTGITTGTGTIVDYSVFQVGSLIKTEIFIDITGLNSGGTDGDIIGVNSAASCHIGRITAAVNGAIKGGRMTCIEATAGGSNDIDLFCGDESTGTEDAARSGLTNGAALVTAGGAWSNGTVKGLTAAPAANQYLYLTGNASDATYTAGIFVIELWGQ